MDPKNLQDRYYLLNHHDIQCISACYYGFYDGDTYKDKMNPGKYVRISLNLNEHHKIIDSMDWKELYEHFKLSHI